MFLSKAGPPAFILLDDSAIVILASSFLINSCHLSYSAVLRIIPVHKEFL